MSRTTQEYSVGPCPNPNCSKGGQVKGVLDLEVTPVTDVDTDEGVVAMHGKILGLRLTHDCSPPVTRSK